MAIFTGQNTSANELQLICEEKQRIGFYYSETEESWKPTLMDLSEFPFVLRKPKPKDEETLDKFGSFLPPRPYAFVAVTTEVGTIFNACPSPPNDHGYMKCGGSGRLEINIKTGRFTKYSSNTFFLFELENNEDFSIVEPVSVTLGDCKKLR